MATTGTSIAQTVTLVANTDNVLTFSVNVRSVQIVIHSTTPADVWVNTDGTAFSNTVPTVPNTGSFFMNGPAAGNTQNFPVQALFGPQSETAYPGSGAQASGFKIVLISAGTPTVTVQAI